MAYPLAALSAALLYQATNPAIYYMIGMGVYFWAYSEGEVSSAASPVRWRWIANTRYRLWPKRRGAYPQGREAEARCKAEIDMYVRELDTRGTQMRGVG